MTLKSSIRQAEHSIAERRGRLSVAVDGIAHSIGKRMVSPGVLVTAGLCGAALHREHRIYGLRMLALLKAGNFSLGHLRTLTDRTRTTAASR